MCGRYASSRGAQDLADAFDARDETDGKLVADFNIAPTKPVPAVLVRAEREDKEVFVRRLQLLRWGLIPSWAKAANIGAKMINARVETLADKPAFRKAFAARRCLLPADGYYEWTTNAEGKKQPFFHRLANGSPLVMAGLYEIWHDPADEDPDSRLWSATVITTTAPDEVGHLHDRSPMVLDAADWDRWLDPTFQDRSALARLLRPAVAGRLEVWPVGMDVNSVRNNGPELVCPIELVPPPEWV